MVIMAMPKKAENTNAVFLFIFQTLLIGKITPDMPWFSKPSDFLLLLISPLAYHDRIAGLVPEAKARFFPPRKTPAFAIGRHGRHRAIDQSFGFAAIHS